jgi:hypothetical protein
MTWSKVRGQSVICQSIVRVDGSDVKRGPKHVRHIVEETRINAAAVFAATVVSLVAGLIANTLAG